VVFAASVNGGGEEDTGPETERLSWWLARKGNLSRRAKKQANSERGAGGGVAVKKNSWQRRPRAPATSSLRLGSPVAWGLNNREKGGEGKTDRKKASGSRRKKEVASLSGF